MMSHGFNGGTDRLQPDSLFNNLIWLITKITQKLCIVVPLWGNLPVTSERASKIMSISWRHHGTRMTTDDNYCSTCTTPFLMKHYSDVIMGAIASQITSVTIVYSTVYSDAVKKKIKAPRLWPFNSPVTSEFPAQRASKAGNVLIW